ncbi:Pro-kumamolisin [Xylariomycetidae sp. FL0641]|nr:Pro-kumamolisin [Xylariomycetidae sp. FL0641]
MIRSTILLVLGVLGLISALKTAVGSSPVSYGRKAPRLPSRWSESSRVPSQWKRKARAQSNTVIHLRIGLAHAGREELERRLYEVSDPSHSRYGFHLLRSDVEEMVKPSNTTVQLAKDWLRENDIFEYSSAIGDSWIAVSVPVRKAESLLHTEFYHFVHEKDGGSLIRSLEWSVPAYLKDHVDTIQPTTSFYRAVPQDRHGGAPIPDWEVDGRVPTYEELVDEDLLDLGHIDIPALEDLSENPTVEEACNRLAISSLCLRVLYGTLGYEQQVKDGSNKIALVNFLGNNNNLSDLQVYAEKYRPDAASMRGTAFGIDTVLLAGATDQQTPNTPEQMDRNMGLEGALDAQTLLGTVYPMPIVAYSVGGRGPFHPSPNKVENSNEPYLEWLHYLLAQEDGQLPQVISISYADEEQTVPESYAKRVCEAFALLGARGVSVIVASGDDGVGKDGKCFSNDGTKRTFLPTFPASCPFVTAVGGTRHLDPVMVGFDAKGGFSTGGGFSNYFSQPSYQREAVRPYVEALNTTYEGLYNPEGRGIPDVSTMGYHFPTVWAGVSHLLDGTSASAPAFAAVIAMINDALLAENRPALGFLNPWLYSEASSGLEDVTIGSNRGCNTVGFPAMKGWDAATGLGTPWFPILRDLALKNRFRWSRPWYVLDT